MGVAFKTKALPLWGRRRAAPVGGYVGRSITPPSVGCADTSRVGGGL
jgi:hypothetical protein